MQRLEVSGAVRAPIRVVRRQRVNAQLQTYKSRILYLRRRPPDGCITMLGGAPDLSLILRLALQTTAKRLN